MTALSRWRASLVACCCVFAGCASQDEGGHQLLPEVGQPVRVVAPERGPMDVTVRGAGTLGAQRELDLAFKTGGVVSRVRVAAGDRVEKGQLLALIDATEYSAQLQRARQGIEKAERDYARGQQLQDSGALPSAQVDDARTNLGVIRAEARVAAFNLEHTRLVAPEAGVIDHVLVHAGEIVSPGRPAFRLSAGEHKVARIGMVDRDALAVRVGDRARIWLDARPQQTLAAHVSNVASVSTLGTGTFAVELSLDAEEAQALPTGLSVKAEVVHSVEMLTRVPVSALVEAQAETAAVFAVEGSRVRRVPVTIRWLTPDNAVLQESLLDVERVVKAGVARLRDGGLVVVFNE